MFPAIIGAGNASYKSIQYADIIFKITSSSAYFLQHRHYQQWRRPSAAYWASVQISSGNNGSDAGCRKNVNNAVTTHLQCYPGMLAGVNSCSTTCSSLGELPCTGNSSSSSNNTTVVTVAPSGTNGNRAKRLMNSGSVAVRNDVTTSWVEPMPTIPQLFSPHHSAGNSTTTNGVTHYTSEDASSSNDLRAFNDLLQQLQSNSVKSCPESPNSDTAVLMARLSIIPEEEEAGVSHGVGCGNPLAEQCISMPPVTIPPSPTSLQRQLPRNTANIDSITSSFSWSPSFFCSLQQVERELTSLRQEHEVTSRNQAEKEETKQKKETCVNDKCPGDQ